MKKISTTAQINCFYVIPGIFWIASGLCCFFEDPVSEILRWVLLCVGLIMPIVAKVCSEAVNKNSDEMYEQHRKDAISHSAIPVSIVFGALTALNVILLSLFLKRGIEVNLLFLPVATFFIVTGARLFFVGLFFHKAERAEEGESYV